jgi:hypothetical protein
MTLLEHQLEARDASFYIVVILLFSLSTLATFSVLAHSLYHGYYKTIGHRFPIYLAVVELGIIASCGIEPILRQSLIPISASGCVATAFAKNVHRVLCYLGV